MMNKEWEEVKSLINKPLSILKNIFNDADNEETMMGRTRFETGKSLHGKRLRDADGEAAEQRNADRKNGRKNGHHSRPGTGE